VAGVSATETIATVMEAATASSTEAATSTSAAEARVRRIDLQ